jgi:hypothetical protein
MQPRGQPLNSDLAVDDDKSTGLHLVHKPLCTVGTPFLGIGHSDLYLLIERGCSDVPVRHSGDLTKHLARM